MQCAICSCEDNPFGFVVLPTVTRAVAYKHKGIFIPNGSRCCNYHLNEFKHLTNEALESLSAFSMETKFTSNDIIEFLNAMASLPKKMNYLRLLTMFVF